MAEPLIIVSTWRIKEGKLADYERFYRATVAMFDENEPQIIAFHGFMNEARTEITSIQVHPDEASMDRHLGILAEKIGLLPDDMTAVLQYVEPVSIEIYGPHSARVTEMNRSHRDAGLPYKAMPRHLAGFTHTSGT